MAAKWQPSGDALSPIESTPAGKICRGAAVCESAQFLFWRKGGRLKENGRRERTCR
nr:MAG TPA: hypothetical protein [Caudoviricetes sp.]